LEPSRQNSVQAWCKMRSQYCTRMEWYCHEEWQGMEWQYPGQKECKSIVGWFVTRDTHFSWTAARTITKYFKLFHLPSPFGIWVPILGFWKFS
jgi:hypothetical protein